MDEPDIITPLVLVGPYFRTGSTLVMEVLSASPQIAMTRIYPYEHCFLTYLIQTSELLAQTTEPTSEWDATIVQNQGLQQLQAFPFQQHIKDQMFAYFPKARLDGYVSGQYLLGLWHTVSQMIHRRNRESSGKYAFYSEKMPAWAYARIKQLMSARGLFTLRDPRDIFVSACRWFAKNKSLAPNPIYDLHDPGKALKWAKQHRTRLLYVIEAARRKNEFVIRYEDLIQEPAPILLALQQWLNIEFTSSIASQHYSLHTTSASPQASIGRWRNEMPPKLQAAFLEMLHEELAELSYEV